MLKKFVRCTLFFSERLTGNIRAKPLTRWVFLPIKSGDPVFIYPGYTLKYNEKFELAEVGGLRTD